jgi:hypothetical protein
MRLALLAGYFAAATGLLQGASAVREYPAPDVREEQTVVVNGVAEVWQLKWRRQTNADACGANDLSFTCPCQGFGFGEGGELDLIRFRNRVEIDRLAIDRLFSPLVTGEGSIAVVQRWQPAFPADYEASQTEDFAALVSKRPSVQVMHFADYDHDGHATEFYLQTESLPCGKSSGVVIGISKRNQRLHAFGTASKPDSPLYMRKNAWDALRDASGPVEVVTWPCADHGSDREFRTRLRWTTNGIEGIQREFVCAPGRFDELIKEEPL